MTSKVNQYAYKMEIGSDDDDLNLDIIYALPQVDVKSLSGPLEKIEGDEFEAYFGEALYIFDIYQNENEELFFVPKKGN